MASLKDLRNRIASVKSTKKITSAMKMVAAAKLKKAQEKAVSARPYAEKMNNIISSITENIKSELPTPSLISGTKGNNTVLLIVCSADRGLCGGFNGSIIRQTKKMVSEIKGSGKKVKFIFVGKKAYNGLKSLFSDEIIKVFSDIANPIVEFNIASEIRNYLVKTFKDKQFDVCHLIYTKFNSAINQEVIKNQLIPLNNKTPNEDSTNHTEHVYEFEPNEEEILNQIVPQNLAVQIFTGLLESSASEHGARMTAMDNATRNANDMIDGLTLFYNRSRQAVITKELIEIISGAEAI